MPRLLFCLLGLVIAVPTHAVPIITLHGGGVCSIQIASTAVDATLLVASLAALIAVVAVRVYRRKTVEIRRPRSR